MRIFEHYKGGMYGLLGYGHHTETNEEMVIYVSLNHPTNKIWLRPRKMFEEMVEVDTGPKRVPRFREILHHHTMHPNEPGGT